MTVRMTAATISRKSAGLGRTPSTVGSLAAAPGASTGSAPCNRDPGIANLLTDGLPADDLWARHGSALREGNRRLDGGPTVVPGRLRGYRQFGPGGRHEGATPLALQTSAARSRSAASTRARATTPASSRPPASGKRVMS